MAEGGPSVSGLAVLGRVVADEAREIYRVRESGLGVTRTLVTTAPSADDEALEAEWAATTLLESIGGATVHRTGTLDDGRRFYLLPELPGPALETLSGDALERALWQLAATLEEARRVGVSHPGPFDGRVFVSSPGAGEGQLVLGWGGPGPPKESFEAYCRRRLGCLLRPGHEGGVLGLRAERDGVVAELAGHPRAPVGPAGADLRAARADLERRRAQLDAEIAKAEAEREADLLVRNDSDAQEELAVLYRARAQDVVDSGRYGDELVWVRRVAELGLESQRDWVEGRAWLSLATDPPGVDVTALQLREVGRRIVPQGPVPIGKTPLREAPSSSGNTLLVLRHANGPPVRLHVYTARSEVLVLGGDPFGEGTPIRLPRSGELDPSEVFVPPGWFWSGGDPLAVDALPARRHWLDGFVISRFPLTSGAWREFVAATGGGDVAEILGTSRVPVNGVTFRRAEAYRRWRSERDGLEHRFPHSLEVEKAGRGVDRRLRPCGNFEASDFFDVASGERDTGPAEVDAFPFDESPYGVRGLGGGVRVWCCDRYRPDGFPAGPVPIEVDVPEPGDFMMSKGGTHFTARGRNRLASRYGALVDTIHRAQSLRLARSFGSGWISPPP